ncbi:hypothetical protein HNQ80_000253 [Anaerosolibacter carboniphilus]|uniref:DUF6305 domain-containing protein n=1 Tax=Anaerosolibacter carboniphilus TaxID=1417629 RepID=A0A841KJY9_9FIRM|nr:DUF6305 family protein [Anaerosolibacter carboniphilus]MBB6214184.1 hypothetical protein [Anaerosolibacter carboniphilus]
MKIRYFMTIPLIALVMTFILDAAIIDKKREMNILLLPSLPKPIAKEYVLITSAGQGTDAYIITDIANKLMIHNYFMPQAKEEDLEGAQTLVFVVGYSAIGEKLHGISHDDEKQRIIGLLKKAEKKNMVVITIYIGGKQRHEKRTEDLLSLIIPKTDYLIGTKEANKDNFLSELTKNSRIPITLVNEINDLSEPFSSAFR